MSATELETAVRNLRPGELAKFTKWFEEYIADQWDRRIEEDIRSGKLDRVAEQADSDFESGLCRPL